MVVALRPVLGVSSCETDILSTRFVQRRRLLRRIPQIMKWILRGRKGGRFFPAGAARKTVSPNELTYVDSCCIECRELKSREGRHIGRHGNKKSNQSPVRDDIFMLIMQVQRCHKDNMPSLRDSRHCVLKYLPIYRP
jgi:hypothetical protein